MNALRRPCIDCGQPTTATRCDDCDAEHKPAPKKINARAAGYDSQWDRLSKRLRKIAVCSVCGTRDDLQLDHLPGAWERVAAGKRLRPGIDVDVKCGRHNREAGARRTTKFLVASRSGEEPRPAVMREPAPQARKPSHTPRNRKISRLGGGLR